MASMLNALVVVLVTVATLLHGSAAQTTHVVGDSTGWTIPPAGATAYANWATKETFTVGDTLVFNFIRNVQNVAEVTKEKFGSCDITSPLVIYSDPPVRVSLINSGEYYFICEITGHCAAGQKLTINVTTGNTSTPPSPTNPSTMYPPDLLPGVVTTRHSGATSLGAAAFSATLLSYAAAFLF